MQRSTDSTNYPSVTEILGRMGALGDFSKIPRDKLEYARQRGEAVHHAIALECEGRLDESSLDSAIGGRIEAWRKFKREWNVSPLLYENELVDHVRKFKGHPDQVSECSRGLWLFDFKNTAGYDEPGIGLQLGGYEELLDVNTGWKLDGRAGVQLQENGEPRIYIVPQLSVFSNRILFLNFMACFQFLLRNGRLRD